MNSEFLRPELKDFSSIICFKSVVVGMEDALGPAAASIALKAAGRQRGAALAASLGFGVNDISLRDAAIAMNNAIGAAGTRLCIVDDITEHADDDGTPAYRVHLRETVCSAGEPQGSPRELSFTHGAVHGALEVLLRRKLRGKQVGSVLRGQTHDILEFRPR